MGGPTAALAAIRWRRAGSVSPGPSSYGDRMASAAERAPFERAGARGSAAPAAIMECAPGCRCAAGGSWRVREALWFG